MLKIREEQLETLSADSVRRFEQRMIRLLQTRWPVQTKDRADSDLLSWVQQAALKAAGYGIVSESDVERFLLWAWPRGLNLEELPPLAWAVQILHDHHFSPTEKLNELDNYEAIMERRSP